MATPFFQIQNTPITITPGSPGQTTLLTKDATGAAIDVSSGFTLTFLEAAAAADYNSDGPNPDLSSHVSAAFTTTGVTLSWTSAQANTISHLLGTLHSNVACFLSNDSGTTASTLAISPLTVNNAGGLI